MAKEKSNIEISNKKGMVESKFSGVWKALAIIFIVGISGYVSLKLKDYKPLAGGLTAGGLIWIFG